MRTPIFAALALLAFGSTGAAATADTTRVLPETELVSEDPGASSPQGQTIAMRGSRDRAPSRQELSYERRPDGERARYQDRYGRFGVRVWLDNDRDVFRVGDRSRVALRVDRDAYVTVLHIDTNGDVELLFPSTHGDDGYLRGGRSYGLRTRGDQYLNVRGGYGIGYVFAIASDEPMDPRALRELSYRRAGRWDSRYSVYGDPFEAMERLERTLVSGYGDYETDYYSYHVGRRYTHPRYACYNGYGSWYHSRAASWDSCDRVRVVLVRVPYYYDTRYYRGDRRVVYRGYDRRYDDRYGRRAPEPEHGYKERTDVRAEAPRGTSYSRRPAPPAREPGYDGTYTTGREYDRDEPRQEGRGRQEQEGRATRPERERPTFQRRAPEASPPSREEGRRAEPRSEPRETAQPRREEPRRESPPARESSKESSPRERPSARVAPPRE